MLSRDFSAHVRVSRHSSSRMQMRAEQTNFDHEEVENQTTSNHEVKFDALLNANFTPLTMRRRTIFEIIHLS